MLNAQFHLFQEAISQFTVVIVLENTNQMIQVMKDHLVTTEAEDHHMGVIQARNNSRPSRGKSDKFLRKQESFYSGGSAKFNESLQKKLYEILGGKKCSSCGSDDERSLGICDANNNQISADTGRGSSAGSWGKYISAPDAAKKELKVFCSNCNDSVKPAPKPRDDRPKSKRSKYFSR